MSTTAKRPLTLLIAALGGEGGGVLTNWIVAAAQAAKLPVQATSIPGVAQRTGATTYYIEIWPEPVGTDKMPVMSLSPAPGEVDIVATTELLEAGRCILNGFVSPERTHLIASTHRVYTTIEKMAVGDGRFDNEALLAAAKARARDCQLLNIEAVAQASGARISAVLLGMLAGSGKLPLAETFYLDAIGAGGKAVEANQRGFKAGLAVSEQDLQAVRETDVSALIGAAEVLLSAYQDKAYAALYRARLKAVTDGELLSAVAKGLAHAMAYADIIDVARLKVRPGRLAELTGAAVADDVVHVTEYFRPGLREICDILPTVITRTILRWAQAKPKRLSLSWPMAMRSTTITGFLLLKLLAALRPLRRFSYRFHGEQAMIEDWLAAIAKAQDSDPALALEIARNVTLIKGYGDTHARGQAAFDAVQGLDDGPAMAAARAKALSDRPA